MRMMKDRLAEAKRQAECKQSPACQDAIAEVESRNAVIPVRSATGRLFTLGHECVADCALIVQGYQWAKAARIIEPWQCASESRDYLKGRHQYLHDQATAIQADYENGNAGVEPDDDPFR